MRMAWVIYHFPGRRVVVDIHHLAPAVKVFVYVSGDPSFGTGDVFLENHFLALVDVSFVVLRRIGIRDILRDDF